MTTQQGSRVSSKKQQVGHGFARGQPLVYSGGLYQLATAATGFDGVCGTIPDVNRFELVTGGELDGLSGLTPETTLYLSSSPGVLSATGTIPVLRASTAIAAWVLPQTVSGSGDGITEAEMAAAIADAVAAEAARIDAIIAALPAATPIDPTQYLHSIQNDAVISVDVGNVGVVFDETDGTQVLVG